VNNSAAFNLKRKEQREERKAKGLCISCLEPALPKKTRCEKHRKVAVATMRKKRGILFIHALCVICKKSYEGTTRKCATCTAQVAKYDAEYKQLHKILKTPKTHKINSKRALLIAKENMFFGRDAEAARLDWSAAKDWIKSNIELWDESWVVDHPSLDNLIPHWIPAAPYYNRMGSIVSFEDYCIENIDRAMERSAI
jgi:hypothetical protein